MIVRIRPQLDIEKVSGALSHAAESDGAIEKFENAFASGLGAAFAVAVDRGRSALLLALKILGLKEGDEVIVQSFIFHVVVDAILEVGARPVLADSSLDNFNIDPQAIEREMTPATKAIIVTHLGIPCDMEEISALAVKRGCYLIENCAHTLGAEYNGEKTGKFGDLSFYSFDVDKPISTGDGGMLVINNPGLLKKAREVLGGYSRVPQAREKEIICGLLLHHFVTGEEVYPEKGFLPVDFGKEAVKKDRHLLSLVENAARSGSAGGFREGVLPYLRDRRLLQPKRALLKDVVSRINGRASVTLGKVNIAKIDSGLLLMNSVRSAVGTECLKDYDRCKSARDRNTQYYIDHLDPAAFKHPAIGKREKPAFIRYAVLNNTGHENARIAAAAREQGFEIGIFNWSAPVHQCYPYNRLLDFDAARLRKSEQLGKRLLSLPVHPYIDRNGLDKIVGFLNGFAGRKG